MFFNSQSYRCFKSVCLWSLLGILTLVVCFFSGYILTLVAGLIKGSAFAQGFGWIVIILPTILLMLLFVLCFAIANGYLFFVLYLECTKSNNIPLLVVEKTEAAYYKIVKNEIVDKIVSTIAIIAYFFGVFIFIIKFYAIIICAITFVILLVIYKIKRN